MGPVELAAEVACWAAGTWLMAGLRRPGPHPRGDRRVSIIVPARDEAASLPRLLAGVAAQGEGAAELIVVDDHSVDATAALAVAGGARARSSPPLPAGWTGKAWACHQGALVATGEVLVFVDADTWLEAGGLDRIVGEQRVRQGLVSVEPFHVTKRPYERLSAWCNLVSVMGTGAFAPFPGAGRAVRAAAAFGPCIVVDRPTYDRLGGHAHPDVRASITEDLALARRARAAGVATTCLVGDGVIAFRMYPGGLRPLVEGWTKNLAAGAGAVAPLTLVAVVAWITGTLRVAGRLAVALAAAHHPDLAPAVIAYAATAGQVGWMLRRLGRFGWATAVLWPLPLAAFVALFATSLVQRLRGRPAAWRGRHIPTR